MKDLELLMGKLNPEQKKAFEDFQTKAKLDDNQKTACIEFLFFTEKLPPEQKCNFDALFTNITLTTEQKIYFAELLLRKEKVPSEQHINLSEFKQISDVLAVPADANPLPPERKWRLPDPNKKDLEIFP